MFADCCQAQSIPHNRYRGSLNSQNQPNKKVSSNSYQNYSREQHQNAQSQANLQADTPLKIKLLNALGLSEFIIDKFIFARPPLSYKFHPTQTPSRFHFTSSTFKFLPGYQTTCTVIDIQDHFIPVIHLRKLPQPKQTHPEQMKLIKSGLTLVYSHGNSSNLQLSFQIVQMMARKYPIDYIVYDYTGYGNKCVNAQKFDSTTHKLSDKSICSDLLQVIKWSKVPLQKIILWGYSLGCHPSLYAATQLKVNSIILQSPFASIYSMVNGLPPQDKPYKNDIFCNINLVEKIKSDCLLIHSQDDDLIPVEHSKLLVKKFNQAHQLTEMRFIEIGNIKHNEMPLLFCVKKENPLQQELTRYLLYRASITITSTTFRQQKMKKKPIQLKGNLQTLEQKFEIIIDRQQLSQMSQSIQSSVKNIEFQMRQQQKRYFPAMSKKPLNLSQKNWKGYQGVSFQSFDTEVSDEILLSQKQKHEKKLRFGAQNGSSGYSLRSKKQNYSFSIV